MTSSELSVEALSTTHISDGVHVCLAKEAKHAPMYRAPLKFGITTAIWDMGVDAHISRLYGTRAANHQFLAQQRIPSVRRGP
jgi:hypothetical protein